MQVFEFFDVENFSVLSISMEYTVINCSEIHQICAVAFIFHKKTENICCFLSENVHSGLNACLKKGRASVLRSSGCGFDSVRIINSKNKTA